jgi:hypothetical protein
MFTRLLSSKGRVIMCGPTESIFYRAGRRIAGYQNEYHHRTVFDVDRALRRELDREAWVRIPSLPLPTGFRVGRYVPRTT